MEFAKKYALVSEDQLSKHVPTQKHMSDLDNEMSRILNSSLNEYEKLRKYYDILQKKLNMENFNLPWKTSTPEITSHDPAIKEENPIKQEPQKELCYDSMILNSVPPSMRNQANHLLQILKNHSNMLSWNEKGEISLHNQKYEHSNIGDLFNLLFTHNKKKPVKAQHEFLSVLHDMNVPKHLIKNKYLSTKNIVVDVKPAVKGRRTRVSNWLPYK
jgi:hypothetical protein